MLDPKKNLRNFDLSFSCNLLVSPSGIPEMQTAEIANKLKEAEPTMVLGPKASASKLLPMIPTIASIISGADDPTEKYSMTFFK